MIEVDRTKFQLLKECLYICNIIYLMVVISKANLVEFGLKHADSIEPLNKWYEETKKADWSNFSEMKKRLIRWMLSEMTDMFLT